jgi:hypothetical protein
MTRAASAFALEPGPEWTARATRSSRGALTADDRIAAKALTSLIVVASCLWRQTARWRTLDCWPGTQNGGSSRTSHRDKPQDDRGHCEAMRARHLCPVYHAHASPRQRPSKSHEQRHAEQVKDADFNESTLRRRRCQRVAYDAQYRRRCISDEHDGADRSRDPPSQARAPQDPPLHLLILARSCALFTSRPPPLRVEGVRGLSASGSVLVRECLRSD